jgi:hypothetical protein
MAHDVFISYSSKDKPIADAVCARLESAGIRCWIAPRDILPGMEWGASIVEAIEVAHLMVLVLSAHADASPQILREVERAVNKELRIVPLRIEDFTPGKNLEYFLGTPHWLDAITPPFDSHLEQIVHTVTLLLEQLGVKPHPVPASGPAAADTPPVPGVVVVPGADPAAPAEPLPPEPAAAPTAPAPAPSAPEPAPAPPIPKRASAASGWRRTVAGIGPRQRLWIGAGAAAVVAIIVIAILWSLLSGGPVASELVGTWARISPFGPDQMHLNFEIDSNGKYVYSARFVEDGKVQISGQKMYLRTWDGARRFVGTVAPDTNPPTVGNLVAAAPAIVWNVIARFSGATPQFPANNPFTLKQPANPQSALWTWDVNVGGIPWNITFTFNQDGTYKFVAEASDDGMFTADSGRWTAHSTLIDKSGSGAYSIVNGGTLVLSGSIRGMVNSDGVTETIWVRPAALAAAATPSALPTAMMVPTPVEPTLVPIDKRFLISKDTPVYQAAQTSSAVLAHLRRGKWVHVDGLMGNWLQVQLSDGSLGFIPVSSVE